MDTQQERVEIDPNIENLIRTYLLKLQELKHVEKEVKQMKQIVSKFLKTIPTQTLQYENRTLQISDKSRKAPLSETLIIETLFQVMERLQSKEQAKEFVTRYITYLQQYRVEKSKNIQSLLCRETKKRKLDELLQ